MPSDGDGREYRPPRPAQKTHGDFIVTKDMPGSGNGRRCWPPRPAQKWPRDFLALLGEMPNNGNSQEYRPPRPAQKPYGDFLVAEDMPGEGDDQRCWPPLPLQKLCGTSWRRLARCQATPTAEIIGYQEDRPPRPTKGPHGDFVVAKEMPGEGNGHRCWPPGPAQKFCGEFLMSMGEMPSECDGGSLEFTRSEERREF